ncbi:unnamed protein product [Parnassius apollo]|uniref:(apollo) hypothetical protein n=1 Tax=Parnassius apollo TaxID=110799 RepID=A0A8S3XCE2_PARAO|nr:unnamed protein product [Parnassius apollo]
METSQEEIENILDSTPPFRSQVAVKSIPSVSRVSSIQDVDKSIPDDLNIVLRNNSPEPETISDTEDNDDDDNNDD